MSRPELNLPCVLIETPLGAIVVEIDVERAPTTGTNFLRHIDRGVYRGAGFYRAVRPVDDPNPTKVSVVQAGLHWTAHAEPLEPIVHESTEVTGLRHDAGTVSMARDGVGTADSEFFIVVDASPELDAGGARQPDGQGFAAFGRVVAGMEIVRTIQALAQVPGADLHGALTAPVPIKLMRRLST